MKYWSNKLSNYVDINDYEYRLDNVIYSYNLNPHANIINFMRICIKDDYYEQIIDSFQITSNAHIIIEVENSNIECQCYDEFLILNELALKTYPIFYTKAYIVFDTASEYVKWKLKI